MQLKLNRNAIKYIAACAMLIDHIGMLFVPITTVWGVLMRVIGRIAAPVFCLFAAEGYIYTSCKWKYILRLAVFAVIAQFPYSFMHYGKIFVFNDYNMMFTLLISVVMLLCVDKLKQPVLKMLLPLLLLVPSYFCDWGIFAPLWVVGFYLFRESKNKKALVHSVVSLFVVVANIIFCIKSDAHWYGQLWQLGLFLFLPILYLYDGEKCKSNRFNKWFFYVFYPLHLAALGLIAYFA